MRDYTIYAAGPITGCTAEEATSWRGDLRKLLPANIRIASPLRDQTVVTEGELFNGLGYDDDLFNNQKALTIRDRFDCLRADLVLVNLLGTKRVSIGSVGECFWADSKRTPLVIVMEPDNIHQHAMLREIAGWVVPSLQQAARVAVHTLLPEGLREGVNTSWSLSERLQAA